MDDLAGVGNGYVDIFTTGGPLVPRFATQGTLNSPWGLAETEGRGSGHGEQILVGNFGDGLINAFDEQGNFLGQIKDSHGTPVAIDGLWGLTYLRGNPAHLFFTAGPNDENDGEFGYLQF